MYFIVVLSFFPLTSPSPCWKADTHLFVKNIGRWWTWKYTSVKISYNKLLGRFGFGLGIRHLNPFAWSQKILEREGSVCWQLIWFEGVTQGDSFQMARIRPGGKGWPWSSPWSSFSDFYLIINVEIRWKHSFGPETSLKYLPPCVLQFRSQFVF